MVFELIIESVYKLDSKQSSNQSLNESSNYPETVVQSSKVSVVAKRGLKHFLSESSINPPNCFLKYSPTKS